MQLIQRPGRKNGTDRDWRKYDVPNRTIPYASTERIKLAALAGNATG